MKSKVLIVLGLTVSGILLCILSIFSLMNPGESGTDIKDFVLLILGCMLMLCGALLKYREELSETERQVRTERVQLDELELKGNHNINGWKLKDHEYRLAAIEKKKPAGDEIG